jgi:hypothetical protein
MINSLLVTMCSGVHGYDGGEETGYRHRAAEYIFQCGRIFKIHIQVLSPDCTKGYMSRLS